MATLSLPTNTPTPDGAVIGCTTDDTTGTAYAMVRTDRQWYSVANGDSQALADADKATIVAQDITAPELVWAGTDEDLATIQLTIDGLAARLDPANPYYIGWVQTDEEPDPNLFIFTHSLNGFTYTHQAEKVVELADGSTLHVAADVECYEKADYSGGTWSNGGGTSLGIPVETKRTLLLTGPRDMTDAAWTKPNGNMLVTKDAVGRDGSANTACTLTAGATDSVIIQGVTSPSNRHCYAVDIKVVTLTGTVSITINGGTNWTDVTSQLDTGWNQVWLGSAANVIDPSVGIKIGTSGDEIIVDYNSLHNKVNWPMTRLVATSTVNDSLSAELTTLGMTGTQVNDFTLQSVFSMKYASTNYNQYSRMHMLSSENGINNMYVYQNNTNSAAVGDRINNNNTSVNTTLNNGWAIGDKVDWRVKRDAAGTIYWDNDQVKTEQLGAPWGTDYSAAITTVWACSRHDDGQAAGGNTIYQMRVYEEALENDVIEAWPRL